MLTSIITRNISYGLHAYVIVLGMSMASGTLWPRPDHTVGKHDVLVAYMKAWVPILGQRFGKAMVVDGFAGPGEYETGEPGSPLLSWRVAGDHKTAGRLGSADLDFRFFDSDPARVAHLHDLMLNEQRFSGMHYEVEHCLCADRLPSLLRECNSKKIPMFVMLDPFGLKGVSLDLIGEVLSVPHSEFLFSFMHETAVRFGETAEVHDHLIDLVGDEVPAERSANGYCDILERRLRSLGSRYVLKFALWEGGRHVYTLFFGTRNIRGCEVMKDAMWSVAKGGSYRFDGVRRHQPLLLSEDAFGFDELVADLVDAFGRNEWIPVEKLDEFMAGDGTLFRKSHLRSKVLKPLQDLGGLAVRGGQSRPGVFPPKRGIEIQFLQA